MTRASDPVLHRFRAALDAAYGERLARVVLFGSRARGDARPDSDYEGLGSVGTEAGRIAAIGTDILLDTGAVINALPFPPDVTQDRTALMSELRRDGVDL